MRQGTFLNMYFEPQLLTHQTWSIDRSKQVQYFSETFRTIWRTGAKFQALFNLATYPNYSITNYDRILVFHCFENVNKGNLKMLKVKYEKWPDFAILPF